MKEARTRGGKTCGLKTRGKREKQEERKSGHTGAKETPGQKRGSKQGRTGNEKKNERREKQIRGDKRVHPESVSHTGSPVQVRTTYCPLLLSGSIKQVSLIG